VQVALDTRFRGYDGESEWVANFRNVPLDHLTFAMRTFGAFEAKNKVGQWLDLVERGEEVVITRHGRRVARLVPAKDRPSREKARAALRRILNRAEELRLGPFDWAEWKAYRDEGRR
jgi:prevent-host-death family protein